MSRSENLCVGRDEKEDKQQKEVKEEKENGWVDVGADVAAPEAPSPAVAAWAYWGHADGHWQWLPMDTRCSIALEEGYQEGLSEVWFAFPLTRGMTRTSGASPTTPNTG